MRYRGLLVLLIGLNVLLLIAQIEGLSIGYQEAVILYEEPSLLQSLIQFSLGWLGQNDYALRLPMILLHAVSVVLLYGISRHYLSRESDRLWLVFIYMLLPGVTSAALVVDNAGLMIAALFLFVYLHLEYGKYALVFLPLFLLIDPVFSYLYFAVLIYGAYRREHLYILVSGAGFALSVYLYGLQIGGAPESRFLDTLGVYSAIFSPIVFVYLFYVLYRRFISRQWDLVWTVASTTLVLSLLLSFRQKLQLQSFAPFLLIALPLAAQTFFHTYRVRLREFRRRYRILFYTALALLIINALAVFFNQWFYRFLENPSRHFAYSMEVAKELSVELRRENISCVDAKDKKLQLRLRFYGITQCDRFVLEDKLHGKGSEVTISYKNTPVFRTYVTKVNK